MKSSVAFIRQHVLPTILCFGVALALAQTRWLRKLEASTLDDRTRFRVPFQAKADPRLVVIGIDDDSIDRLASTYGRWPWARRVFGEMNFMAGKVGTAAVVWDLLFAEPDTTTPDNDAKLAAGTRLAQGLAVDIVFGARLAKASSTELSPDALTQPLTKIQGDVRKIPTEPAMETPLPALQKNAYFALADTPPGDDGVRRVAPLLGRIAAPSVAPDRGETSSAGAGDRVYSSLALEAVLRFWQVLPEDVEVRLGDAIYVHTRDGIRRIPIDETGGFFVNYRFAESGANLLPFAQLLLELEKRFIEKDGSGKLPDLKGKILLVGQNSTGLTDNGLTPHSRLTPLVLVHANIIDNILRGDYASRSPTWMFVLGWMVVGVAGLGIFSNRPLVQHAAFALGVPVLYVAVATATWTKGSLAWPIVWPLLGFAGLQVFMISRRLLLEQRAKEHIKGMFGTYVSPAVVNRIIESGEVPQLGGHEEEITAYFSDIQGFSTFSEVMPPDRLVALMNEYLTLCTDIVQEEGGTLDKYIGDAIVAMFGAPIALPDHAYRACVASQRVQQALVAARARWQAEGDKWPAIVHHMRTRIGLNTGRATIGNMGSRSRFNYTMMGDNVNLAARMESGAKTWGVYTLITDATKQACDRHGGDRVVTRPLGKIVVMGRSQPVPVHEVLGLKETVLDSAHECAARFAAGLARYWARDWEGAWDAFRSSAALEANQPGVVKGVSTNPSLFYLHKIEEVRAAPPDANWDGTVFMKEK